MKCGGRFEMIKEKLEKKVRELEVKHSGAWMKKFEQIGKEITEALEEAKKAGILVKSITVSSEMPFFKMEVYYEPKRIRENKKK